MLMKINISRLKYLQISSTNGANFNSCLQCFQRFVRTTAVIYDTKNTKQQNYYEILGIKRDCPQQDIRLAYLDLCKKYHPDRLASNDNVNPAAAHNNSSQNVNVDNHTNNDQQTKEDNVRFQKINEAYNCLSKVDTRNQYDLSLDFNGGVHNDNNPFMSPRHYYYHQNGHPNDFNHYYYGSPFQDRASYTRYQRYRQRMHNDNNGESASEFFREMFGTKFTGFMLVTLLVTLILQGVNSVLNVQLHQDRTDRRYARMTEIYNEHRERATRDKGNQNRRSAIDWEKSS